jgi:hypothetical protein
MKPIFVITAAASILLVAPAEAATPGNQQEINQALSALPSALRAKASVITYNAKGDPLNLRWGILISTVCPIRPGYRLSAFRAFRVY